MVSAVALDLRGPVAFCILRAMKRTGMDVSWFLLSHVISVVSLRFASKGGALRFGMVLLTVPLSSRPVLSIPRLRRELG